MFNKIQIPFGSKFNGDTAIELLHLIQQVYNIYEGELNSEDFSGETIYGSEHYRIPLDIPEKPGAKFKFSEENLNPKLEYRVLERIKINEKFWYGTDGKPETTIALILQRGKKLYFVFRGTRELTEWVQNSDYSSEKLDKLQSHQNSCEDEITVSKGFIDLYCKEGYEKDQLVMKSLEASINDFLNTSGSLLKDIEEVYMCGHSLGGALATIAAIDICDRFGECFQPIIYTYASPKVGNLKFAEKVEQFTRFYYRIYNTEDLVPYIPFSCNYTHLCGPEMKDESTSLEYSGNENSEAKYDAVSLRDIPDFFYGFNTVARAIFNILRGFRSPAEYCHAGESISFTTNTSYISTNHNLYHTHGVAIHNGWREIKAV
jgi:hypothetical protein